MQYIILIFLFLILPALGIQEIGKGNVLEGLLCLLPLLCLIVYLLYYFIDIRPKEKLAEAACKKYNLPDSYLPFLSLDSKKWDIKIQSVMEKALKEEAEQDKIKEIEFCKKIAQNIHKGPLAHYDGFSDMHRAFILTGCHITITDDKGEFIEQIV